MEQRLDSISKSGLLSGLILRKLVSIQQCSRILPLRIKSLLAKLASKP
jgi:hypothetical protein